MILDIIRIKRIIQSLLDFVKKDYEINPNKTQTWLYNILNGEVDGNYDFYEQAKEIFLRGPESPRSLSLRIEMPRDISNLPCIVIRESSRTKGQGNTIGKVTEGVIDITTDSQRRVMIDCKHETFELMCISANPLESILISEILYNLLLGNYNCLAIMYNTVEINLKELTAQTNLIPDPIMFRSITLDIDTVNYAPTLQIDDYLEKVTFVQDFENSVTL